MSITINPNAIISMGSTTSGIPLSEKGQQNGVATLDSTGKVPSIQLPSGHSGSGEINVIEYDPEQYTQLVTQDLSVITAHAGAAFDTETGIFSITDPVAYVPFIDGYQFDLKYSALKLATTANTGTLRIDMSETTNSFDIIFLVKNLPINLELYMKFAHHSFIDIPDIAGSAGLSLFADNSSFNVFAKRYLNEHTSRPSSSYANKIFDLVWGTELEVQAQSFGMTVEALIEQISPEQLDEYLSKKVLYVKNIDSPEAHLFYLDDAEYDMYFVTTQKTAINSFQYLDAEDIVPFQNDGKIKIEFLDVGKKTHFLPPNLNDGDYVHVQDTVEINGKRIAKDSFLLMYAAASKFIQIKQ